MAVIYQILIYYYKFKDRNSGGISPNFDWSFNNYGKIENISIKDWKQ